METYYSSRHTASFVWRCKLKIGLARPRVHLKSVETSPTTDLTTARWSTWFREFRSVATTFPTVQDDRDLFPAIVSVFPLIDPGVVVRLQKIKGFFHFFTSPTSVAVSSGEAPNSIINSQFSRKRRCYAVLSSY